MNGRYTAQTVPLNLFKLTNGTMSTKLSDTKTFLNVSLNV